MSLAFDGLPPPATESRAVTVASQVVGLLVFLAGIAMIVLVFSWTYRLFSSVDQQIAQVKPAPAAVSPAASGQGSAKTSEAGKSSGVVVANPHTGPTLADVSAVLALKLLAMFVLGWTASLVAARGAALATGRRGH